MECGPVSQDPAPPPLHPPPPHASVPMFGGQRCSGSSGLPSAPHLPATPAGISGTLLRELAVLVFWAAPQLTQSLLRPTPPYTHSSQCLLSQPSPAILRSHHQGSIEHLHRYHRYIGIVGRQQPRLLPPNRTLNSWPALRGTEVLEAAE